MRRSLVFLLIGAPLLCSLPAQVPHSPPAEKNWQAVCLAAKAAPLQEPKLPGPLTPAQLQACDVERLYYGNGVQPPNYAAALQCGWSQRAHPDPTNGDMFLGPGVLTMLYANGYGVPRNDALAIRFACEDQWTAEAEQEGRIGHLEARRDGKDNGKFDLCDDTTSGLSMGACQAVTSMQHAGPRDAKIDAEVGGLPASAKALFPALQLAEKRFEEARSGNEIDLSGTARGMFYQGEMDTLADQFLINLQRFRRNDVPAATAQDLATLDTALNATYQGLQHAPATKWESGTIKPTGIRDTERAWLQLVDAWVSFGRVAYPQVGDTRLRAQLIRLRLHQLKSLGAE